MSALPPLCETARETLARVWAMSADESNPLWRELLAREETAPQPEMEAACLTALAREPDVLARLRNEASAAHQAACESAAVSYARENFRSHRESYSAVVAKLIERRERAP